MFYNHLIFSKVTLSLRICLKYLVFFKETDCSVKGNTLFCLAKHLLFAYLLLNQNNFSMFATLFMRNMTFV